MSDLMSSCRHCYGANGEHESWCRDRHEGRLSTPAPTSSPSSPATPSLSSSDARKLHLSMTAVETLLNRTGTQLQALQSTQQEAVRSFTSFLNLLHSILNRKPTNGSTEQPNSGQQPAPTLSASTQQDAWGALTEEGYRPPYSSAEAVPIAPNGFRWHKVYAPETYSWVLEPIDPPSPKATASTTKRSGRPERRTKAKRTTRR